MDSAGEAGFGVERTVLADGSVRLLVVGSVDSGSSCDLLDVLVEGIVPGRLLIVDLAAVTRLDETGAAALAVAAQLARLHDGECRVVGRTSRTGRALSPTAPVGRRSPADPSR